MLILGIPYGNDHFVDEFWKKKITQLKDEISYFNSFHFLTYQAKSIISKSKLLPVVSFVASTLCIPSHFHENINNMMLKFFVPHGKTFLSIDNLATNKEFGGIECAHIVLHCSIMLIRNVLKYVLSKKENRAIEDKDYFIEFNIGQQLSSLFKFPCDNMTPHRSNPNVVYGYILDILKMFKPYGIDDEILLSCKVKVIYKHVLAKLNESNYSLKYRLLHASFMPNYLITFNYKVHFNLLPVKSKFMHYGLENESCCKFCNIGFESTVHLFAKCVKLQILWDFFDEVMCLVNINFSFKRQRLLLYRFDVMNLVASRNDLKLLIYLNTIINHQIWKFRNSCIHQQTTFDHNIMISKILRSIGSRKNFQHRFINDNKKIPRLEEIFTAMLTIQSITSKPIDNG